MNATKEKILNVAIDLFSRKGFSAVSIREITREVGIKESSLYNHFRNKDEILETIFSLLKSELGKVLPPFELLDHILSSMTPATFLRQGILLYKEHVADSPITSKILRILSIEQYRDPRAREIMLNDYTRNALDFLEVVFDKMIEKKQIKSLNPRVLAAEYQYPIFAMLSEYQILKFDDKDTRDIEQRMEDHIQFFINNVKL